MITLQKIKLGSILKLEYDKGSIKEYSREDLQKMILEL